MFGTRVRIPRPVLLLIVYGIFLVIVGVTAVSQAVMVSVNFSAAVVESTVGSDAATIRTFVIGFVRQGDLTDAATASDVRRLEQGLAALTDRAGIARVELIDPAGTIVAGSVAGLHGVAAEQTPGFVVARDERRVDAALTSGEAAPGGDILRAYLPLIGPDGSTRAVVAIWRDAGPLLARLDGVRRDVVLVTVSAAVIVSLILYLIFRSAQGRITRQTEELVEATRRDPLTGLLSHGALVGELAGAIETARRDETAIGVVLLDLDNFRALNDSYGHEAGDGVLLQLARNLRANLPEAATVGRYGPDEYLVIAPAAEVAQLEPMVDRIRAALADESLAVASEERMPISISAGIAVFPTDAESVTDLLSAAAVALGEARASGGDSIRVAGRLPEATTETRAFDALQGLVIAVDTKDRYTKRHSEDVARYGAFLAEQLGLDAGFVAVVRTAGLLHDVGKIGIPDAILRKPGKLTDDELEIVKQHVALGDSIVRNIDDVEVIRAGIRHHHERWDGRGYLHALAGEDIPLIARILSVGDTFSAMTTTRPYRKALSTEEALRRLGDAAGTQLDEELVGAFISAMESRPDAPLPEKVVAPTLRLPQVRVA